MALPWLAALTYLLLGMRLLVDVRVHVDRTRKGACIALRAYGLRLCLDLPIVFSFGRDTADAALKSALRRWPFLRAALKRIRWGQTDVRLRIGANDASLTAVLTGGVRSLASALQAVGGRRFPCEVRVEPDFRSACFALDGRCIFSLVPGDIMFAVLKEAVKKTQREGLSWLSIPLKA